MKIIKTTYMRPAFLSLVIMVIFLSTACHNKQDSVKAEPSETVENPLSSWTDSAQAKTDLMDYLAAISDEGSEDYIPAEDRIAVFDLDGTRMCETCPRCFEYMVFVDYVLNNQDYTPSDEVRAVAQEIIDTKWQEKPSGMSTRQAEAAAIAYAGLSPAGLEPAFLQECRDQNERAPDPLITLMLTEPHIDPDQLAQIQKLAILNKQNNERMAACVKELEQYQDILDAETTGEVIVTGDVFPGTKIVIGDVSMVVKGAMKYCRFVKDAGDVKMAAIY